MSYVDEILERVVAKNPAEPEFHQAVKEVLESLRVVVEANEETYRREALLERLVEPERQFKFRTREVLDFTHLLTLESSNSLALSRSLKILLPDFRSVAVKVVLTSIQRENPTERLWHSARAS